jgi:TRAP transporter TAXI family solute receptor
MLSKSSLGVRLALGSALIAGTALMATAQARADDYKWPKYFNVITPIVSSANHSLAVAWTGAFTADTGVRVRVLPTSGAYSRAEWLDTHQGRLSLYQPSDYFDQMDAVEGYSTRTAGPHDTRLAYINLVTPWGFMVRGDSDIKTVNDLKKGTRVAFYTASTFISNGMRGLIALAGLKESDIEKVEVGGYAANTKVVTEGRAQVTFTSPLSGTSYEAEANPHGIRWLAVSPKNKNYTKFRALNAGYILQKTVSGTKSAIGVVMDHAYQSNHVRADEDPEFVYHLAKWLDENLDKFKGKFRHAKMMNIPNLVQYLEAGALEPLHEGTIRYLKEKGLWKDKYQVRQDKIVALAKKYVKVFDDAMDAAGEKKIMVDTPNDKWQKFLADYKKSHGITRSIGEEINAISMN